MSIVPDVIVVAECDKFRSRNGSYDCLVPGSGGKDSFYASHVLKTRFGMHPLTVTWAPHIYTEVGWRNFQAWIHSGFTNFLCTPDGRVHRTLTRLAFEGPAEEPVHVFPTRAMDGRVEIELA